MAKDKQINIRADAETYKKFDNYCKLNGVSQSEGFRMLLQTTENTDLYNALELLERDYLHPLLTKQTAEIETLKAQLREEKKKFSSDVQTLTKHCDRSEKMYELQIQSLRKKLQNLQEK